MSPSSRPQENAAPAGADGPAWRQRAVSRSLEGARSRAEQRVQRFLDAAFSLIDEKGSTDFTIQEIIDRSKQSLRGFYQHFEGKDDLLLALFDETIREAAEDLAGVIDTGAKPIDRLHAFTVRLHEWCDPDDRPRKRGSHNRRPIMDFMVQLAASHPDRVKAALAPVSTMLVDLLDEATTAGVIHVEDTRHTAALMQQTVFSSWLGNRLVQNPKSRPSAEETWEFCLHGLGG